MGSTPNWRPLGGLMRRAMLHLNDALEGGSHISEVGNAPADQQGSRSAICIGRRHIQKSLGICICFLQDTSASGLLKDGLSRVLVQMARKQKTAGIKRRSQNKWYLSVGCARILSIVSKLLSIAQIPHCVCSSDNEGQELA